MCLARACEFSLDRTLQTLKFNKKFERKLSLKIWKVGFYGERLRDRSEDPAACREVARILFRKLFSFFRDRE